MHDKTLLLYQKKKKKKKKLCYNVGEPISLKFQLLRNKPNNI